MIADRPLSGLTVSLSISETSDSSQRGFPGWQINRVTLQLVAALFGQGVAVIFGHDWREDGIMQAVHGFAQQVQAPIPPTDTQINHRPEPLLWNLLPWPDEPYLSTKDLDRLSSTLRVQKIRPPEELQPYEAGALAAGQASPLYRYLRARSLTALRRELTDLCTARVCIGGRETGFEGRYAGIIEETILAVELRKPVYLVGLLGGAAEQMINALSGKMTSTIEANTLYKSPPISESSTTTAPDRNANPRNVLDTLRQTGIAGISQGNRLSIEENEELFHTPSTDRVIELMLKSLARLRKNLKS